jgi:EAL domain-containing protein (putative c-di-GMP-specific phosphodiesterase class I)
MAFPMAEQADKNCRPSGCSQCRNTEALAFDFSMAFQPVVDTRCHKVFAQEALARGPSNETATTILDKLTEDNLYRFDQACRVKAIELASRFESDAMLSINFMPRAVYQPERCIRTTLEAAEKYSFDYKRIIFEFNEAERVDKISHLKGIVEAYQSMGFKTAIDDFGAGYSGLNQLTDLQPDLIKLDMKLIRGIDHCSKRQIIVRAMVNMCRDLGTEVIAEGIETADEKMALDDLGIYFQQGYLYAKPAFEKFVTAHEINW